MENPQRNDQTQQPEVKRAVRVRGRGVRKHNRRSGRKGDGHRHVAD